MAIARRGLKVEVMGKANAVGPTSIEGDFFISFPMLLAEHVAVGHTSGLSSTSARHARPSTPSVTIGQLTELFVIFNFRSLLDFTPAASRNVM